MLDLASIICAPINTSGPIEHMIRMAGNQYIKINRGYCLDMKGGGTDEMRPCAPKGLGKWIE